MDRRSWLWRRKSSEKTPGDTESSGSLSSPSERFSDEQVISIHSKHSPEITSKATLNEEPTEKTKTLTEKLSAALLTINANEELVKQHAKVAEEAVTGWEKAEKEVAVLKSQLDATLKKNSALEDRVGHLDGALKECVRQLRQAREEHERKLEEVIAKRTYEWELTKSELESQLVQLSSQLEAAESEAAALRPKLEVTEKENKSLRLEIGALSKKLEVRTLERDFSTQTAESASKQRLDCIKKLSKLEAECRRLRSNHGGRSKTLETDANKINESSQLDSRASSSQATIMDDFLEMEKLAALPEKGNRTKAELETMISKMTDLEDKIAKLEEEKGKLEMAFSESEAQLKASKQQQKDTKTELMRVQNQLIEWQDQPTTSQANLNAAENELIELQTQLIEREDQLIERGNMLNSSQVQLKDAESNLVELQIQLTERDIKIKASQGHTNDMEDRLMEMQAQIRDYQGKLKASEEQIKDTKNKLVDLQAQLDLTSKIKKGVERELQARINSLVDEAEKQRALYAEAMTNCQRLEDELSKKSLEVDPHLKHLVSCKAAKKAEQEKGLAMAAGKLEDCQKTIASLGKQLKSLATLEEFLVDSDNPLEFSKESSVFFRTSEPGKLPCIDCQ